MKRSKYFYQAFIYCVEHNSFIPTVEEIFGDKDGVTGFKNSEYKKAQNAVVQARNEIIKISKKFYPKWYDSCEKGLPYEDRDRILREESKENGKKFAEYLKRVSGWYKEKL